jgi:serine/threonine protein kinase
MASANLEAESSKLFNKGRYTFIEEIGEGGFGRVFLAFDKQEMDR